MSDGVRKNSITPVQPDIQTIGDIRTAVPIKVSQDKWNGSIYGKRLRRSNRARRAKTTGPVSQKDGPRRRGLRRHAGVNQQVLTPIAIDIGSRKHGDRR